MKQFFILIAIPLFFLSAENPVWQKSQGRLPYGGRWVGMEEKAKNGTIQQMAICRGAYEEVVYPGRFTANRCSIGVDGQEVRLQKFEILLHKNSVEFIPQSEVKPGQGIPAGGSLSNISYICITKFKGNWYPGRLDETFCRFGYKGDEIKSNINVYVLVLKK